jgi:prephenate dehydratase
VDVVAYQGEAGAYSEQGALALFPDAEHQALPSIRTVFEAVEVGRAGWGLVPMDNSQAGSINETYDLFLRHGLHLVGETVVRVDHCLLALPGSTIDDLREVVSHPQAIAQCEEFLATLDATVRAEYNTAGAAKRISENRLEHVAAIASHRAAELYGLEVLAERIQTYPDNHTRFGALSRSPSPLSEPDKSSLVFGVGHVAGSLYRCLGAFAERHLNLTKLESRPRPGRPWEYVFYADVDAPAQLPEMVGALATLSEHATFTRLLGTYARSTVFEPSVTKRVERGGG